MNIESKDFFKTGKVSGNDLAHPHFIIGRESEGAGCCAAN
jgi:hypothetical protein